jgi:hypothetical protein
MGEVTVFQLGRAEIKPLQRGQLLKMHENCVCFCQNNLDIINPVAGKSSQQRRMRNNTLHPVNAARIVHLSAQLLDRRHRPPLPFRSPANNSQGDARHCDRDEQRPRAELKPSSLGHWRCDRFGLGVTFHPASIPRPSGVDQYCDAPGQLAWLERLIQRHFFFPRP